MLQRWLMGLVVVSGGMLATAYADEDAIAKVRGQLSQADASQVAASLHHAGDLGPGGIALLPDVVRLLKHDDFEVQVAALELLETWGPAARSSVPQVVTLLEDSDLIVKHAALTALQALQPDPESVGPKIVALLKDSESVIRVDAANCVLAWNLPARPAALSVLKSALNDDRAGIRTTAAQGLRQAGADAIPALQEALSSDGLATKIVAADALGDLGAAGAPAVPQLLSALDSDSPILKSIVLRALGEIRANPEQVVPKLKHQCNDSHAQVRVAALVALGRFGASSATETATIAAALKDAELSVRLAACDALAALGPEARSAVDALAEAMKDSEGVVTVRAAEALGRIGPAAIPALVKLLDQRVYSIPALQTIEAMGPSAKSLAGKLVEMLKTPSEIPQRNLCLAIAAIGADPNVAGPALKQVLADESSEARPAAAYALGRIGDQTAIKELTNTVEADDPLLQLACSWSLLHLDPQNVDYIKIAIPRLIAALDRPEPNVRLQAARTLGELGQQARSATPALVKTLGNDEVLVVRAAAAVAVSRLGTEAKTAVPALIKLAESPEAEGRKAAIYALGNLGPIAEEAVPTLREIVAQGLAGDRLVAAWALLQIRQDPASLESALPIVLEGMAEERPEAVVQLIRVASRVGRRRPEVRSVLSDLLESQDPALRAAAAAGLDRLN